MTSSGRLPGKRIIVTGAGSGLGLESATRFAQEGAQVVIVDIDPDRVTRAAARIGARGDRSATRPRSGSS